MNKTTVKRIAANSTWKHIEQFFLGQFEVYYNKLEWDLEKAREEAYQNTLKRFNGWDNWTTALKNFKAKYEDSKY